MTTQSRTSELRPRSTGLPRLLAPGWNSCKIRWSSCPCDGRRLETSLPLTGLAARLRSRIQHNWVRRRPKRWIVDDFHQLYYELEPQTWGNTKWFGTDTLKCPFDLWVYQEILYEVQPDLIIETGTWGGGSALYVAWICALVGRGKIVTIGME